LSEGKVPINFPEVNISNTPVKTAVQQLATEISSKTTDSSKRLQVFLEKYEKEFKQELADKRLSYDITETEVLRMMKGPLTFYALDMNGQVLIDLSGVLERNALIYIEEVALGWRGEPKTRLYLCRADYDIVYSEYKQEWHNIE
jgi:hypothetical protein